MPEKLDPEYQKTHIPGILIPKSFNLERFKIALTYQPRADDVFINTFPKCGTTYTQQIVYLIYHKGVPPPNREIYGKSCPFLEAIGINGAIDMPRPNAIKTHLRYNLVPFTPGVKYIYMLRNPKDCVVSFYYHAKGHKMPQPQSNSESEGICDFFFNLFCEGEVEFGSYFENLKSWYAHKDDPHVLFLHYEDTLDNTEGAVLKIAQFLGQEYGDLLRNDPKILQDVILGSSFDFMKKQGKDFSTQLFRLSNNVRRGKVGGWRDELTPEQAQRIDDLIEKNLKDVCPDIIDLWKKYDCI